MKLKKVSRADLASISLIALATFLMIGRIKLFPLFVDIYYHLSVVRGFNLAGGVVLRDFWEFAPEGRPHLYPPLLHILMLFLHKCGMSFQSIGTLISFVMFPLSLVTSWFSMKKIFGREIAFFSLLMLTAPLNYMTSQSVFSTAALVLVLTPLLFYFFEREMLLSSIAIMTACLYAHLSMPHITALAFLLYGLFSNRTRKVIRVLIPSYLLYLPWAIHIALNFGFLTQGKSFGGMTEYQHQQYPMPFTFHLFHVLFASAGSLISMKRRRSHLFPLAYLLAMIPIAFKYPARFTDHSLLPLSMLSGIGLTEFLKKARSGKVLRFLLISIVATSLLVDPTLITKSGPRPPIVPPGTPRHQGTSEFALEDTFIISFLLDRVTQSHERMFFTNWITDNYMKVAELVAENSDWDEIIFVDDGAFGCLLTSFTGRAQMGGIFGEVSPKKVRSPPQAARVIVITQDEEIIGFDPWENPPPSLVRVAKVGDILIFRREGPKIYRISIPDPIVPSFLAFVLLLSIPSCILFDILIWNIRRRRS